MKRILRKMREPKEKRLMTLKEVSSRTRACKRLDPAGFLFMGRCLRAGAPA